MVLALGLAVAFPQPQRMGPYQIKAGFIYNFAISTKWPAEDPETHAPLILGILGDDPSAGEFPALHDAKVNSNRNLSVKICKDVSEAKECHLLFISSSQKSSMATIVDELKDLPVLTITDADVSARARGIIHFLQEKDKVRFEINVSGAERAKLKISSQVLKVAKLRRDEPGGKKE